MLEIPKKVIAYIGIGLGIGIVVFSQILTKSSREKIDDLREAYSGDFDWIDDKNKYTYKRSEI